MQTAGAIAGQIKCRTSCGMQVTCPVHHIELIVEQLREKGENARPSVPC